MIFGCECSLTLVSIGQSQTLNSQTEKGLLVNLKYAASLASLLIAPGRRGGFVMVRFPSKLIYRRLKLFGALLGMSVWHLCRARYEVAPLGYTPIQDKCRV